MYITDLFRRYTRAHFTQSKCKDVVVSKIIELWFPIFGNPDMFLMGNGGEFGKNTMRELGNLFGINIKHTAAFSLWSNGVNERSHATVDLMLTQIWVGVLGVRFEVGGKITSPCLKLVKIMLETSNLASKYTSICSFRKYTF